AVALKDAFRTEHGDFDLTAFKACLKDNSLTPPNVDMERPGAIGRFRMCAGLMLRRRATKQGFVVIGGKKIGLPGTEEASLDSESVTPVFVRVNNVYKPVE